MSPQFSPTIGREKILWCPRTGLIDTESGEEVILPSFFFSSSDYFRMSQIPVFYLWWLLQVSFKNYVNNSSDKYEVSLQKVFIGRNDAEAPITLASWCEQLTHWKRPWCWERLKAKGEGGGRGWLVAITDSTDMNFSKLQETAEDKEAWHAAVRGVTESDRLNDWTTQQIQDVCR